MCHARTAEVQAALNVADALGRACFEEEPVDFPGFAAEGVFQVVFLFGVHWQGTFGIRNKGVDISPHIRTVCSLNALSSKTGPYACGGAVSQPSYREIYLNCFASLTAITVLIRLKERTSLITRETTSFSASSLIAVVSSMHLSQFLLKLILHFTIWPAR